MCDLVAVGDGLLPLLATGLKFEPDSFTSMEITNVNSAIVPVV